MATASFPKDNISDSCADRKFFCQPCNEDGKKFSVHGYCSDCREYLCQRCYGAHRIPSFSKKHILSLISEKDIEVEKDRIGLACPKHAKEEVKYHCLKHSFVGCSVCSTDHNKLCKDLDVIETLSSEIELNIFNEELTDITKLCTERTLHIKRQKELVQKRHAEAKETINQQKQKLVDLINTLHEDASKKANMVKNEETLKLDEMLKEDQKMLVKSHMRAKRHDMLQNRNDKVALYLALRQSNEDLESRIQQMKYNRQSKLITFKPNKDLPKMLEHSYGFGSLQMKGDIEKIDHVLNIDIRNEGDWKTCSSTTLCMLSNDKLIVADSDNSSVKLIDTKKYKLASTLKLSANTDDVFGVCRYTEHVVAVTLMSKWKIMLVGADPTLSIVGDIGVNGEPRGIDYRDGKFVVSFDKPRKVEIIDTKGTVISAFEKDDNGKPIFDNPAFNAIHPCSNLIFVSDHCIHKVVCMTFDGIFVATYTDTDLKRPRQVTFDSSGNVYICGYGSHNMHQITESCNTIRTHLFNIGELQAPSSVTYQESEGRMYIGQQDTNFIKVYQLHLTDI